MEEQDLVTTIEELEDPQAEMSETAVLTQTANEISLTDFAKMKVADRDVLLFALLREVTASQLALELKLMEYEQKARDLMSPEGVEEIKQKVFEALGFGGNGGGMFGGMFS